jgi:hypothetical protein
MEKKYCTFYCKNVNLFSRKYISRIGANVINSLFNLIRIYLTMTSQHEEIFKIKETKNKVVF